MKNVRPWFLLPLLLVLAGCGVPADPDADPSDSLTPSEDVTLDGGSYQFTEVRIPAGVKATFTGAVEIEVAGDATVEGELLAPCHDVVLSAEGDVTVNGTIDNACEDQDEAADLLIETVGGRLFVGSASTTATLLSSGDVVLRDDETLEQHSFDLPPGESPSSQGEVRTAQQPPDPVCTAAADTLRTSLIPDEGATVRFFGDARGFRGAPLTYSWDFGDGSTSDAAQPLHTYQTAGVYDVTLEVTVQTASGDPCEAALRVVVEDDDTAPEEAGVAITPAELVIPTGQPLPFSSVSAPPARVSVTHAWDFGDGSTSDQEDPTHVYTSPGRYEVNLKVEDGDGNESMASATVLAYAPVAAPPPEDPDICEQDEAPSGYSYLNATLTRGQAGTGQDGRSLFLFTLGGLILGEETALEAQDGGDGQDETGSGLVVAGDGGRGGGLYLLAGERLIVCGGSYVGGSGGDGGEATSTGDLPRAVGGRGGTTRGVLFFSGISLEFEGPLTIDPGNGGDGGNALAVGDDGPSACVADQDGARAYAAGGTGGRGTKTRFGFVFQDVSIVNVAGGRGGDGGDAEANGGNGGNATCEDHPDGGDGGLAWARGGDGGNAFLRRALAFDFEPDAFTGGDGGEAQLLGGTGGNGYSGCDENAGGDGGDGGRAVGYGGLEGRGMNVGTAGSVSGTAGDGGRGGRGEPPGDGGPGGTGWGDPNDPADGADGLPGRECDLLQVEIDGEVGPEEDETGTGGPLEVSDVNVDEQDPPDYRFEGEATAAAQSDMVTLDVFADGFAAIGMIMSTVHGRAAYNQGIVEVVGSAEAGEPADSLQLLIGLDGSLSLQHFIGPPGPDEGHLVATVDVVVELTGITDPTVEELFECRAELDFAAELTVTGDCDGTDFTPLQWEPDEDEPTAVSTSTQSGLSFELPVAGAIGDTFDLTVTLTCDTDQISTETFATCDFSQSGLTLGSTAADDSSLRFEPDSGSN